MSNDKVSLAEIENEHAALLPPREEMILDTFILFGNGSTVIIPINNGTVLIINVFL